MKLDLSKLIINKVHCPVRLLSSKGTEATKKYRKRWAILLKYQGKTVYRLGKREYKSDSTHAILLPKGSTYSWKCIEAGGFLATEFECDLECPEIFSFDISKVNNVTRNILKIEKSYSANPETYELASKKELYGILIDLFENTRSVYIPSEKYLVIKPAITYLQEHYAETNITNEILSDICGISTVYFRKIFTAYYDVSPMQYLKNLRIEKAKNMLMSDYTSITDVALSSGYGNIYHFSKMFREYTGVSPSEFARNITTFKPEQ